MSGQLTEGWVEWVEGRQLGGLAKPPVRTIHSSHYATKCQAHATLVGLRNVSQQCGSNFRSPPPNWCPILVPLFQTCLWRIPIRKATYPPEKQTSRLEPNKPA